MRLSRNSSRSRRRPICTRSSVPPTTTICSTGWSEWWPAPRHSVRIVMSTRCRQVAMCFEHRSLPTSANREVDDLNNEGSHFSTMIDALTELSKLLIRAVNGVGVGIGAVEAQRGLAWKVCEPGDLLSEAPSPRQNPCVPADFEPDSGQAEN